MKLGRQVFKYNFTCAMHRTTKDYTGLYRTIKDYTGLYRTIQDYREL